MRATRLFSIVRGNLRRSRNHFLLASVGVVVGIATFAFFLSLGLGVRKVVLGKIFPLDKLEVVPKAMDLDLGPLRLGTGNDAITDDVVADIAAIDGVETVYPKMKLTVPSVAYGGESLFGTDLRTEIVGDGIDQDLVVEDMSDGWEFIDRDTPEQLAAKPVVECKKDDDCEKKQWCGPAPMTKIQPRQYGKKKKKLWKPEDEEDDDDKKGKDKGKDGKDKDGRDEKKYADTICRNYVPIIVSHHVVELYNGTLRRAHNFPKLNPDAVRGFTFDLVVGASMVSASREDYVLFEKGQLVGFSDKAIPLGFTMPLGYTQRYNVEFGAPEDAQRYHSVIVKVPSKDHVARVAKGVEDLELDVTDSGAEQAALLIAVFMLVFGLVSAVIVGIAAVNIMHVFFMLVYERQREIGVMRAVGASRGDVARIILGEASVLGAMAGTAGIGLAFAAGRIFDEVSVRYVPDFPYKPETYFEFPWWLVAASLGFAVSFCVLGALLPSRRAARMEPARVLSGQ